MKITDSDLSPVYDTTGSGIARFRQMVLDHYRDHGREMPWRENTEPYHILVSEIMLQQTQVERVTGIFPGFIAAFPDFGTLAEAPLPSVLSAWQGLGYNRRAIALQQCAARVMAEFGGVLPDDPSILATFPGIGHATASSICAFAFNQPVIFIETNIRRVFIHYFFSDSASVSDNELIPLVERALPAENSRIWYWALMDLGTVLKKTVANPNRRSVHYTKQSAFAGSDRKIRGEILRLLLDGNEKFTEKIIAAFPEEDPARMERIISGLERDGFIVRSGDCIRLAS
ncbi:MAG: A/G-specific adenine glycosylase [Methanoregula sp.]